MSYQLQAARWRGALQAATALLLAVATCAVHSETAGDFAADSRTGTVIGHGDGRIHIIPSLSSPSCKNGEKLTISAVIKAAAGIDSVTADIGGLETVTLQPSTTNGGVNSSGTAGLWSAQWTGHDLEEKYYTVAIKAVDRSGHVLEDKSLQFSDPIAGLSTPGSTAYPPSTFSRVGAASVALPADVVQIGVIDVSRGHAYFVTTNSPSAVVKVDLGVGSAAPTRIGSVTLNAGESGFTCGVIDPVSGFAYFGASTSPGLIVKIALGAGNAPPTRVGALTLNTGENDIRSAVVDAAAGYAYFGVSTSPNGSVVKVALGAGNAPPTRVGAVLLPPGTSALYSAVINTATGHAYFGTNTAPGQIVKISLGTGNALPTYIGILFLPSGVGENNLVSAVLDANAGFAYFGTGTTPGRVIKVALGTGNASPTRAGAVTLNSGEGPLNSAAIDAAAGYAYFTLASGNPGRTVKVALGAGSAPPARLGVFSFGSAGAFAYNTLIDPVAGYVYSASFNSTSVVIKSALGSDSGFPAFLDSTLLNSGEEPITCSVIDTAAGYAYLGTGGNPGKVVKVALGTSTTPPSRVGAVSLNAGESFLTCAVIDSNNGYAYFVAGTDPGIVVRIALGAGSAPPTRVDALTLNAGDSFPRSAVIDPGSGFAYLGTATNPGIVVKIALATGPAIPTRIGALVLPAGVGENNLMSAVIDPAAGYAWFGTGSTPAKVVKVALGAGSTVPTRVGATPFLSTGENGLSSAVIDTAAGYAYFGTQTSPGIVVKIALGAGSTAPSRVGALTLNSGEDFLNSAVMDSTAGHAYFTTGTAAAGGVSVVKVGLGLANAAPTRLAVVRAGPVHPFSLIDTAAGYAYVGTTSRFFARIALRGPLPAVTTSTRLFLCEGNIMCGVIDAAAGYAYFGTDSTPGGTVIKVALGNGSTPPTRIGAITLNDGENGLRVGVIDANTGYAYFNADQSSTSRVIKIALGSGNALPTRVGSVDFGVNEHFILSGVIDPAAGYAYFGTTAGRVVKVALGAGNAPPERVNGLVLNASENPLTSAVLDTTTGYAYFGTDTNPGLVVKVAVGVGNSPPTRIAATTLNSESSLYSAVIDPAAGFAYFGARSLHDVIVKVALGSGNAAPVRVETAGVSSDLNLFGAVIDPAAGAAYFGLFEGFVAKMALGSGGNPLSLSASISMNPGETSFRTAILDSSSGYAYFGGLSNVVKVRTGIQQGSLKATRTVIPENATLQDVRFYSNVAGGNIRLGIYDNATPRKLRWQSESIPNAINANEIIVPISSGTPAALSLDAGTYWLAWQIDSSANVPSYTPGNVGDGFTLDQSFGSFAATLGTETITSERWTQYVSYYPKPTFTISAANFLQAGQPSSMTISANRTEYSGTRILIFSGAHASSNPVNIPTVNGFEFGTPTPVTFVNGVASPDFYLYKSEAASISAVDAALDIQTPVPKVINVFAGVAHHFSLSGPVSPQNAGVGQTLVVTAQDAFGNTCDSYAGLHSLKLSGALPSLSGVVPTAGGVDFGIPVLYQFVNGFCAVPALTLYKAETAAIDVTDFAISASPKLNISVRPLAKSQFGIIASQTQVAGTTQNLTILALDVYFNTDSSFSTTTSAIFSGAGSAPNGQSPTVNGLAFGGNTPLTFVNGVAQAGMSLYKVETATLGMASNGLPAQTPTVTVVAGTNGSLNLTGGASQLRGVPFNVLASAFDVFGNPNTTYSGVVSLSSSDGAATLPVAHAFQPGDAGTFAFSVTLNTTGNHTLTASDGSTSKTIFLNVAPDTTPAVTWANPASITSLTPLSALQLNATANVQGTFTYTPPVGTLLNVGSNQLSVAFLPSDNSAPITKTVSITVTKGTPTLLWPAPATTAYPTALSGTQLNATANVPGTFTYTPPFGTVLSTGNAQTLSVHFAPDDSAQYNTPADKTASINVTKGVPAITWLNPADITQTTALSSTQLNASANVPGTFVYSPAAGSLLPIGNGRPLTAQFTPADTTNFNSPPVSTVFINVISAGPPPVAAVALGSLTAGYDGTPKSATATTTPAGLSVSFTYNGSATPPANAGSYSVVATVVDAVYQGSASGTLTINKATTPLLLSNLSQVYDGTAKAATISTSPSNLPVAVTYNGSLLAPAAVGSYAVSATINDVNYQGTATGTLTVGKATAGLVLGSLTQAFNGSPRFATAVTTPANLSVTFTYDGSTTAPTAPGTYALTGTISDSSYQGSANGTLVINKAAATITLGSLSQTFTGTPRTATATTTPANLTVVYTYDGSSTAPTNAGTYTVAATITDPNYQGTTTGTLTVGKAAATVTLGGLSRTYDGTPKAATATTTPANLAVTFSYNGSAVTPTSAGTYAVVGTIADTNYQGSSTGTLAIGKAAATVTLGSLAQTYTGSPKAATATTSPAGLSVTFTYNSLTIAPSNAGSYSVVGTIDDVNFQGSAAGTLVIGKASASIALNGLVQTYDGADKPVIAATTPVNLPLSVLYNGSAAVPKNAGSYPVVATINDPNYDGMTSSVLTINKAAATVTLSNLAQTYDGSAKTAGASTSPSNLTVNFTYNGTSTAPSNPGAYAVVGSINDANFSGSASGTLTIGKANAVIVINTLTHVYDGTPKAATVSTTPGTLTVNVTYDGGAAPPTNAGSYAVVATVTGSTLYQGSANATLVIGKATGIVSLTGLTQVYDGTARAASASTIPAGLAVALTYNGSATPPVNTNAYAVVASIVDANYQGSSTGTLNIVKGNAAVMLTKLTATYDGTPKAAGATTTPPGLPTVFTYNGSSTPPTDAGNYVVVGTVVDPNWQVSSTGNLTIGKATAAVSLNNLTQTYDGTAKSIAVTTIPAGLACDVTYGGSAQPPVNAGGFPVVATINDRNYEGTATNTLTIAKAQVALTLGGLTRTFDGLPKSATATTTPSNLPVAFTYSGLSTPPANAGTYVVVGSVSDTNQQGSASGILTINKATATIALSNLNQGYTGSSRSVTATTTPSNLSVILTYNAVAFAPTNAGNYVVSATINDVNYQGDASGTLAVGKAVATVALANTVQTYDGAAKFVAATTTPPNLTVNFTYNGSATAPSAPGSYAVVGTISDLNYAGESSGTLSVNANRPVSAADAYVLNEGQRLEVAAAAGVLANDSDPNITPLPLSALRISGPRNGTLALNATDGSFTYTPNPSFFGSDSFTYQASNGNRESDVTTVTLTIQSVNDAPNFVKGPDQSVRADAGAQSVPGWATAISAGPANESGQSLTFVIQAISNSGLFAAGKTPAVSAAGTLSYTPNVNASGTCTVTLALQDGGGVANGGIDLSAAQTFSITISPAPALYTGALSASGMVNAPFKYNFAATGGAPILFSAGTLPTGLAVAGTTIAGIPSAAGKSQVNVTASNDTAPAGDTKEIRLVIVNELTISTFAGTGVPGKGNSDIAANTSSLNSPSGIALDNAGNVYVSDTANGQIRKIDGGLKINTITGAPINRPTGIVFDAVSGTVYICESGANRILSLSQTGTVSVFYAGTGSGTLNNPTSVAVDGDGNVYVADSGNKRVLKIAPDRSFSVFAGGGSLSGAAGDNAPATSASLNIPFGVACDGNNLYIADLGDHVVRKVDGDGILHTLAGKFGVPGYSGDGGAAADARLFSPQAVAVDAQGNVSIADSSNRVLRQILADDGTIVTLAGGGTNGDGKPAVGAQLITPAGVAAAGGVVYIADSQGHRIRRLAPPSKPVLSSAPVALPNPAVIGQEVSFFCAPPPGFPTFVWNFGDGTTDTTNTNSPKHIYSSPGTYTVTLTATDASGLFDTASVSLTVKRSIVVPDEIITALLDANPGNASLFPLGGGADDETLFRNTQNGSCVIPALKLNYSQAGKDSLSVAVGLTLVAAPDLDNPLFQQLTVDVGGVVKLFRITRGKTVPAATGSSKNDILKFKTFAGRTMALAASFKNASFANTLQSVQGLSSAPGTRTVVVPVAVFYGGILYRDTVSRIDYTVKNNSGQGKAPK